MSGIGERIVEAQGRARLSQRALADETGISQPTLCRIIAGAREPKTNELLAIAIATGCTVGEITGRSKVAERVQMAARATNGASMEQMRRALLHYLELDAYLDDQGIAVAR
ncbi:helix-turn-helix domain-containing protein [Prescottella subtropica]|uniref:helix-turn-helix domain-containing protein n=1 Tax=Prescottella subtropica TaxID=2545757 RepID=UPI0010F5CE98|nr:helix-turn-helix transcriptional regulator [Prescottella subtropica]